MTTTVHLRPLTDIGVADTDRVGGKAAVLGELLRAGFPVPPGYVLPAGALPADQGRPLPAEIVDSLAGVVAALGGPLAVRSSAGAEDLPDASYAGQYESVLGVRGVAELIDAIGTCVESASAARVGVYQHAKASVAPSRMSVLIQLLVDAQAAGVAFTANPVTGDRAEVVLNSVTGLGDKFVSGTVTAQQWSVRDGQARITHAADHSITAEQAVAVAELARRVEQHFGAPQDIEWAIADGQLWLLQARPITALPDSPADRGELPVEVPEGSWQRSNYAPEPLSPMFRSLMLPGLEELTTNLFPYSVGERIEFREIGGWLYSRFVKADGPDAIKAKLGKAAMALAADKPAEFYTDWFGVAEPRLTALLTHLRDDLRPSEMDDEQLLAHLHTVHETWREALTKHFQTGGSGTFVLGELGITCRDVLGWDAPQTLTLLLGLGGKTTEPAYKLADLVALIRSKPVLTSIIGDLDHGDDGSAEQVLERLRRADSGFAAAVDEYLREYGHRTLGLDITEPTVAERPGLVLNLIHGQLCRNFDPAADRAALEQDRAKAEAAARAALAGKDPRDRDEFERVLARAQWAHPGRDDSHFLTQLAGGLLRATVLEVGRRLVRRGYFDHDDDVFLLTHDEVRASLVDGFDPGALVGERAAERAWALANPGPDTYGEQAGGFAPGPWLAALPEQIRHMIDAGMWSWREVSGERAVGSSEDDAAAGLLRGIAGSRGQYVGEVRVILTEAEFDRLRPGDVLVCPETNPQWAVLFPSVGALVTDHGGLLSHPAIIAREYRVPAVLATENATTRLHDGQIVSVDGSTGVVEILADSRAS